MASTKGRVRDVEPVRPGPVSAMVPTAPTPVTPEELYLGLVKRALTRALTAKPIERQTLWARVPPKRFAVWLTRGEGF